MGAVETKEKLNTQDLLWALGMESNGSTCVIKSVKLTWDDIVSIFQRSVTKFSTKARQANERAQLHALPSDIGKTSLRLRQHHDCAPGIWE